MGTMKGYTMPVYTGGQYRIWGLTAIFTHQLLSLLIPELYQFKIKHRRWWCKTDLDDDPEWKLLRDSFCLHDDNNVMNENGIICL